MNSDSQQISVPTNYGLLRGYCWLAAGINPLWAILMNIALPNEVDDPIGRLVISSIFLALGIASYAIDYVRDRLAAFVYGAFVIFALHFLWMMHRSQCSTVWVIGVLILATCMSTAFATRRQLAAFSIFQIVSCSLAAVLSDGPLANKIMLIAGMLSTQTVAIVSTTIRDAAVQGMEKLRTESLLMQHKLLQREMEAAEAVQKTLLVDAPDIKSLELKAYYRVAHRTGGDWYGHYHDKKRNALFLWVGDVTGHGLPSALMTAVACGALYASQKHMQSYEGTETVDERLMRMATMVNQIICDLGGNMFMTMLFCAIDLEKNEFVFVNAGHNFPYLVSRHHSIQEIINRGDPLGISALTKYSVTRTPMEVGDTLFLYTDGLIENRGSAGEALTGPRLKTILRDATSAAQMVETVAIGADKLWKTAPLADDVTMYALTLRDATPQKKAA